MGDFKAAPLTQMRREALCAGPSCCWGERELGMQEGKGPSLIHVVQYWLEAAGRGQYREMTTGWQHNPRNKIGAPPSFPPNSTHLPGEGWPLPLPPCSILVPPLPCLLNTYGVLALRINKVWDAQPEV